MSGPQQRRFTTIDALILFAALGLGAAWVIEARPLLSFFATSDRFILRQSLHPVAAFFTPPTLALLIVRFRQPRPALSLCLRKPGTVACLVAAILLTLEVVNHFLDLTIRLYDIFLLVNSASYATGRRIPGLNLFDSMAFSVGEAPGLAVAGAYLALWSAGLWRAESSWIDRAGRALGWFWTLAALAFILLPLCGD